LEFAGQESYASSKFVKTMYKVFKDNENQICLSDIFLESLIGVCLPQCFKLFTA